jgi:hypothetical protein
VRKRARAIGPSACKSYAAVVCVNLIIRNPLTGASSCRKQIDFGHLFGTGGCRAAANLIMSCPNEGRAESSKFMTFENSFSSLIPLALPEVDTLPRSDGNLCLSPHRPARTLILFLLRPRLFLLLEIFMSQQKETEK